MMIIKFIFNWIVFASIGYYSCTTTVFADYKQSVMESVLPKIEYSLSCNSKWGAISDVTPTDMVSKDNYILVKGHYKQSLFIKGGEFNRLSGTFKAIFDENIDLRNLTYKVSFKNGEVKNECID